MKFILSFKTYNHPDVVFDSMPAGGKKIFCSEKAGQKWMLNEGKWTTSRIVAPTDSILGLTYFIRKLE